MAFHFVFLSCIIFLATALGLFGNISLIYAVVRYKTLHSKHGMLLCFLCVYESIGLAYESFSAARMLTNSSMMKRSHCFTYLSPYIAAITMQAVMLVVLPVDILFSLVSPITHRLMPYPVYGVLVHIPCVCVATGFVIGGAVLMNDEVILVCNPPLALPDPVSEIWNLTTMIANAMALIVYALVVIQVFKLHRNTSVETRRHSPRYYRRILRSTSAVVSISVVCWFAAAGISRIPFTTDPEIRELIHTYAVIPPLFIMCQNYYIYFIMSSEYRYVFKAILGMRKNDVTTLSNARKTTLVAVSIM